MTVSSLVNRSDYVGNDTTGSYNYAFKIFLEADALVIVKEISTNIETILTIATDYTVSNVGVEVGGSIVLVDNSQAWIGTSNNLDSTHELTIKRVLDLTHETDIRNQGQFYPEVIEDVFDKKTMVVQQQQAEIDVSIKFPPTVTASDFDPTLPAGFAGSAGATIAVNSGGNGFEIGPTAAEITVANASAIAAAASAAAALISENAAGVSETNAAGSAATAAANAIANVPIVVAVQSIAAAAQITLAVNKNNQFLRVGGDGAARTASTTPFDTTPGSDILVSLIGTDNANTLQIDNNDANGGCLINGASLTLSLNDIVTFIYDSAIDRYIETSRNF